MGRLIDSVVFHMSETPPSMDIGVDRIREWHLDRGFSDIGYHFVIHKNGFIEKGRPLHIVGAHCRRKNKTSVGVCYVGGWEGKDDRTELQEESMHRLMASLTMVFGALNVFGHYEFKPSKTCPNFNPKKEFWYIAKNGGEE